MKLAKILTVTAAAFGLTAVALVFGPASQTVGVQSLVTMTARVPHTLPSGRCDAPDNDC